MDSKATMPFQWPLGLQKSLELSITADCCDVIFELSGDIIPVLIVPRISASSERFLVACTFVTLAVTGRWLESKHIMPGLTENPPEVKIRGLMATYLELPEQ